MNSSNKILFLTRSYLPNIGGVEIHIENLCKELLKSGFNINILTERNSLSQSESESIQNIHIYRINLPNNSTSKFAIWSYISSNLNLFLKSDIIHIQDVFFWILPIFPILKIFNKKIYITFHGYEGSSLPSRKAIFWHRLASLLTDGNICIGGFHKKWYGVDADITSFGASNVEVTTDLSLKKKRSIVRILFLGRLAEDTGFLQYLAAIRLIKNKSNIILDVFGDGPHKMVGMLFAKKYQLPVVFHGFKSHSFIDLDHYNIAFVSRYLAILECLSIGLPVIAHYNNEIKKDYLLLSPFANWISASNNSKDIARLCDKFPKLHPQNSKINAKKWATQQTWEKMQHDYLRLWRVSIN